MIVVKNVRVLDNTEAFQLFPIEITYVEDGQEYVRLTSATEVIELFKAAQQSIHPTGVGSARGDNNLGVTPCG